jgi:hypothetical protein
MKIIECEQNSPEWFAARCGILSASNFDKLIQKDGKPSKSRVKLLYQLAGEIITSKKESLYQNKAMEEGIAREEESANFYEITNDVILTKIGFCLSDDGKCGCSPDRLVGEEGLLELKNPLLTTHIDYALNGGLYEEYFQQVQGQLFVTGRKWCDLMSYFTGIKPVIVRVLPDTNFHEALKLEIDKFNIELLETVEKLRKV